MSSDREVTYARPEDALWRRTLDGVIILPPGCDQPIRVAGAGIGIWLLLERPAALGVLAAEVAVLYHRPLDEIRDEIEQSLLQLVDIGAVELRSAGG